MSLPEIAVVMMLALIVFGPKRIPKIARTLGGFVSEMRKAAAEVRRTIDIEDVRADLRIRNIARKETRPTQKGASASLPAGAAASPPRHLPAATVPRSNADIAATLKARNQGKALPIGTRDVALGVAQTPRSSALNVLLLAPQSAHTEAHLEVVPISRAKGRSNV